MTLTITRIDNHSQLGDKGEQSWQLSFMIVCVCNRLNEDRVRSAILTGACCSEDVYARCGVRKNCGRCQETIDDMLEKEPAALASAA
jgi:bacterioferritin-associated ferredoxin